MDMETTTRKNSGHRRAPWARCAAVAFAVGGWMALAVLPGSAGAASNHASKSLVISAEKTSSSGTVLSSQTTLYTLSPSAVACTEACQKVWPEVLLPKGVTTASAGQGVVAAKLGSIKRGSGLFQVTYDGKPLYRFFKDTAPGQVHGDVTDKWGKWSAVVTVKPRAGGATTTTTSPGGGGVGF
jgi:predicted lipoprotein with Yx(FWY)xxD motif